MNGSLALIMAGVFTATVMPVAVESQGQVEGEIVQAFSTTIVIKDDAGRATVLQLTPRTQLGGAFKPGDKVIAYVTVYGVTSVQLKTNTALIP